MARTPTRTRKVLLAITLAMLAVVLAAWGVSFWREIGFSREWPLKSFDPTMQGSSGRPSVPIRRIVCASDSGSLLCSWSAYPATLSANGTPLGIAPSSEWNLYCVPVADSTTAHVGILDLHWPTYVVVLGVGVQNYQGPAWKGLGVAISYWTLATMLVGLGIWLWWPIRRSARRRAEGLCLRCGYDRRGLAPAASCPECGEVPAPARAAPATPRSGDLDERPKANAEDAESRGVERR